jgi:hypothetical protein
VAAAVAVVVVVVVVVVGRVQRPIGPQPGIAARSSHRRRASARSAAPPRQHLHEANDVRALRRRDVRWKQAQHPQRVEDGTAFARRAARTAVVA